jgi:hypothetical protein
VHRQRHPPAQQQLPVQYSQKTPWLMTHAQVDMGYRSAGTNTEL